MYIQLWLYYLYLIILTYSEPPRWAVGQQYLLVLHQQAALWGSRHLQVSNKWTPIAVQWIISISNAFQDNHNLLLPFRKIMFNKNNNFHSNCIALLWLWRHVVFAHAMTVTTVIFILYVCMWFELATVTEEIIDVYQKQSFIDKN